MTSPLRKLVIPSVRLACVGALLALAYACDARNPAAPVPAPVSAPPQRLDDASAGDAQLGSLDLGPETPFSPVTEVPELAWALVRVSGAWSVKPNPACAGQPPNWPCSTSPAYSGFAPGYPDAFAGPVRVATFHDGTWDELPMRAFGGAEDGVGLTQREFARTLFAGPTLRNPTVQEFGNTGPSIRSYTIDGTYSVTVTQIQSPLRVTEGAPEADGNRTYTVEPLYGLQMINPLGSSDPPGAIRWYFVPGDSVSTAATSSDPPWSLPACANQPTCRWQPPVPGRVQVAAYVETRRARARSETENSHQQDPKLVLACSGHQTARDTVEVTRGNSITCTVSAQPATATLAATRLTYTDARGHIVPGPAGDGPLRWEGVMVVGGTMAASGAVSGHVQDSTIPIKVTSRTWPRMNPVAVDSGNGELPTHPHFIHDLAHTHDPLPIQPYDTVSITSGPNAGWAYLRSPATNLQLIVHISDGFKPATPFYQLQQSGIDPVTHDPFCSRSQLRFVERGAREHEGLLHGTITSHVDVYKAWFRNHSPQDTLEAFTVYRDEIPPAGSVRDAVDAVFDRIAAAAHNDPDQSHTNDTPPGLVPYPTVPCRPRLF